MRRKKKAQSLVEEASTGGAVEDGGKDEDDSPSPLVFVGVYPRKSPDKVAIPHTRYPY